MQSGLELLYGALQHYEMQSGHSGMAVLFNRPKGDGQPLAPLEEALWELVVAAAEPGG